MNTLIERLKQIEEAQKASLKSMNERREKSKDLLIKSDLLIEKLKISIENN